MMYGIHKKFSSINGNIWHTMIDEVWCIMQKVGQKIYISGIWSNTKHPLNLFSNMGSNEEPTSATKLNGTYAVKL